MIRRSVLRRRSSASRKMYLNFSPRPADIGGAPGIFGRSHDDNSPTRYGRDRTSVMKFVRRPRDRMTMSKDPVRIERSVPAKREADSVTPPCYDIQKFSSPFGFFSFRYSYREVSDFEGRVRLKRE